MVYRLKLMDATEVIAEGTLAPPAKKSKIIRAKTTEHDEDKRLEEAVLAMEQATIANTTFRLHVEEVSSENS